jgi:serine/threonine protein kinase
MVRSNQSRLESMVLSVSPPKAKIERPVRAAPRSPAQDPEHPEPPGQPEHRAERYDLQTKIGGGAFSNIYAAVDREGSSLVAIKVIDTLPSFLSAGDSSEFAIMSGLDHENVVKCLGRSVTPRSTKWK